MLYERITNDFIYYLMWDPYEMTTYERKELSARMKWYSGPIPGYPACPSGWKKNTVDSGKACRGNDTLASRDRRALNASSVVTHQCTARGLGTNVPRQPGSEGQGGQGTLVKGKCRLKVKAQARYVGLLKSHLMTYPCPSQINSFWNFGFLLGSAVAIQLVTGLLLALYYTSEINSAYFSVFFLIREVYFGWLLRFFHSSGASFVFVFVFIHLARGLFYGSYLYNVNTWFTGIIILFLLIVIAFLGYVLPFGQMSFWGATVITNLLSPFPGVIEWLCGGYCVHSPTIKRFFVFHFVLSFLLLGFVLLHLFYLHFHSSTNPLKVSTNSKIPFFPYVFVKDFFTLLIVMTLYLAQCHFGVSTLSHPDNALEACAFLTPLHIVPEWYFLCQYSILKAVPNKNGGFAMLIASVTCLFYLGELSKMTPKIKLTTSIAQNSNISLFFGIFVCFVVVGAQFPQEIFLSYARVLIPLYFLVLMWS